MNENDPEDICDEELVLQTPTEKPKRNDARDESPMDLLRRIQEQQRNQQQQ